MSAHCELRTLRMLCAREGPCSPTAALATHKQSALIGQLGSQTPERHQAELMLLAACSLDKAQ